MPSSGASKTGERETAGVVGTGVVGRLVGVAVGVGVSVAVGVGVGVSAAVRSGTDVDAGAVNVLLESGNGLN